MVFSKKNKDRLLHLLFDKPFKKLIILLVLQFILLNLETLFSVQFLFRWLTTIVNIAVTVYFISIAVHVIRNSFKYLMNPKNLPSLIGAYALFVFALIVVLSTIFSFVELTQLGYITYGGCSNNYDPSAIANDPMVSQNFFYFSAVTFFTVGYGDICPMGLARYVAIFGAFIGHIISVFIVALILNNYLKSTDNKK